MLFITYWELNENLALQDTLQAAGKLTSSGMFPPANVKILRWDITPDNWGILIAESDSAQAVADALSIWRAAVPGFFKMTKTSPAVPVQESMPAAGKLLQMLSSSCTPVKQ
jgi:hypothetical protein